MFLFAKTAYTIMRGGGVMRDHISNYQMVQEVNFCNSHANFLCLIVIKMIAFQGLLNNETCKTNKAENTHMPHVV